MFSFLLLCFPVFFCFFRFVCYVFLFCSVFFRVFFSVLCWFVSFWMLLFFFFCWWASFFHMVLCFLFVVLFFPFVLWFFCLFKYLSLFFFGYAVSYVSFSDIVGFVFCFSVLFLICFFLNTYNTMFSCSGMGHNDLFFFYHVCVERLAPGSTEAKPNNRKWKTTCL